MNEILKTLTERRSCRSYKSDPIPAEILDQILEAGTYAASGMGRQSAIMIAVTDKKTRDQLSGMNAAVMGSAADPFYGAPVIIIVLAKKDWRNNRYDGALVMGNLMLAAHSLGLGSIWINRAYEEFEMPEYQQLLKDIGVDGEWEGVGPCAIGYIDGDVPGPVKRKENRIYWVE